jgi:hypothetical protein
LGTGCAREADDGHNKTFFFTNIDYTRLRSGPLPGFGNTTPIDAFKRGDFSALLTSQQVGTDALGRPILNGQIFDPASTRLANGVPVRDPYPGNIIPANDPLRSGVASQIAALMVHPDRVTKDNAFNVAGNPAGDQTWNLDARNIMFRIDHVMNPNFRGSFSFYWNHRPSIRNCGEVAGCTTQFDGETEPQKNDTYYGNGFYQRISTHHAHQQFDWIVRPNLLNHSTIAYDRWFMGGNPLSAGAGWPQKLWGANQGDPTTRAGPPLINSRGTSPYNSIGHTPGRTSGSRSTTASSSPTTSRVKGRHTLKAGFEYRHHQFPSRGWSVAPGGRSISTAPIRVGMMPTATTSADGRLFASFLLGQVFASNQTILVSPPSRNTATGQR